MEERCEDSKQLSDYGINRDFIQQVRPLRSSEDGARGNVGHSLCIFSSKKLRMSGFSDIQVPTSYLKL